MLKSFRLPLDCADFIERKAQEAEVSESQIVADALRQKMDFQTQWREALMIMATDEEYQKEQLEMAEENYE